MTEKGTRRLYQLNCSEVDLPLTASSLTASLLTLGAIWRLLAGCVDEDLLVAEAKFRVGDVVRFIGTDHLLVVRRYRTGTRPPPPFYGAAINRSMKEQLSLLRHQLSSPSAFTPEALVSAVRSRRTLEAIALPPICVLDFDGDLTDWLSKSGITRPHPGWACFHTTMHSFQVDGMECGLIARTIGGPYAVLVAEQLCVSGVQVVLGLTSAGRVSPSLPLPSLVIATSAIRDEGTSYHYLPAADVVAAPVELAETLYRGLQGLSLPVSRGLVWTTDAPYRETVEQLEQHSSAGVLAVEMQAASLFAFASARGANVAVVAHVTNAIGQTGEPFDKGCDEHGWDTSRLCAERVEPH